MTLIRVVDREASSLRGQVAAYLAGGSALLAFVAAALMVGGIAILGTVTATLASWTLDRLSDDANADTSEVDALRAQVARLVEVMEERDAMRRANSADGARGIAAS